MEAFTTKGKWWLPGNNLEKSIAGILTFDPHGRSELELFGSFDPQKDMWSVGKTISVIHGVGEKGQAITLVKCLLLSAFPVEDDYKWYRSSYAPHIIFQGHTFACEEEIKFEGLLFDCYGLSEWASTNQPWGSINLDNAESLQSELKPRIMKTVRMNDFKMNVWRGYSWNLPQDAVNITRGAWIEIVPHTPWGYEEYRTKIFHFQVFLSLAIGTSTWPLSVNIPHPPANPEKRISMHYGAISDFQESNFLSNSYMIFALKDVNTKLVAWLQNWFAISDRLEEVLRLYNLAVSTQQTLVDRFLTFAQAVEVYHRQINDEPYVDEAKFAEIYTALMSSIPKETDNRLKQRIADNLKWANSPSLRARLKSIQRKHETLNLRLFKDFNSFVQDVVGTRNYLTHYDETGESQARLDGQSLFNMGERLKFILEICLLSELGVRNEEMQQLVDNMGRINPRSPNFRPSRAEE